MCVRNSSLNLADTATFTQTCHFWNQILRHRTILRKIVFGETRLHKNEIGQTLQPLSIARWADDIMHVLYCALCCVIKAALGF